MVAVGEAEALSSLAGQGYEEPAGVFPTVLPVSSPPPLRGRSAAGRVGGERYEAESVTPHPNPPPQGGRGQDNRPPVFTSPLEGEAAAKPAGGGLAIERGGGVTPHPNPPPH